ncbi:MAG: hypothetical protein PVJ27_11205, partial [Candidatus Brocadiaceae bacterium]
MKRRFWIGAAVLLALVVGSLALAQRPRRPQMQQQRMGPMMRGRAGGAIAAWDGSIYMVRGNNLQKLNADLEVVKTVALATPPGPMREEEAEEGAEGTPEQEAQESGRRRMRGRGMMMEHSGPAQGEGPQMPEEARRAMERGMRMA